MNDNTNCMKKHIRRLSFFLPVVLLAILSCTDNRKENTKEEDQMMKESENGNHVSFINSIWDYSDPEGSAEKFRELLPSAEKDDYGLYLELQTQLARALGLQRKFKEAHTLLDDVADQLGPQNKPAVVRYHLERGRVFNSSGQAENAVQEFNKALDLARQEDLEFLAVDAAHMLGIADIPEKQLDWNLQALSMAKSSKDEAAAGWQGSLLNNIAWTYHDKGDFGTALKYFKEAEDYWEGRNDPGRLFVAKWAVARAHRSLGDCEAALAIQHALLEQIETGQAEQDGYVYEELAECYLATGDADNAARYFGKAYELLSQDDWMMSNEKERMDRMKELAG
jgi:tetratricopeptide (TPR) repeat protein